jgi:AraC family transcriptional regulator of adaptative response/methylated-DNA-[protein]-cysteine methyltransferase
MSAPTQSAPAQSDYARIARAIAFLEAHAEEQPTLEDVAASAGLSPSHFQRLFTAWAGVSPKRYLQFRTLAHARALLSSRRPLLEATYAAGLSSGGRLHQLFVSLEAVTPGEFKSGGAGLTLRHGVHPTPFGDAFLALSERGVVALHFLADVSAEAALEGLRLEWPGARVREAPAETAAVVERIFGPVAAAGPAPLSVLVKGTNFQVKVWEALLRIPPGSVATYADVAGAVGAPKAVRAVGSAVGANAVALLIPCHRVLRASGAFGDYRWGPSRKRALLAWEAGRREGSGEADGQRRVG